MKWVAEIESTNKDLPAGFAKGLVSLYLTNPAFFSKENIDKMKNQKTERAAMKEGSIVILPPENSEVTIQETECSDTTPEPSEPGM
jgi:nucleoside 2-deoxyribosyltransferase